jgi:anion-transporting  ArsA/GET3 family ATPase
MRSGPDPVTLDRLVEGPHVLICVGSGGVGKTTVAAAIATELAARGRRVAVLTIDPARRLAESLGLEELGNEPRLVDRDCLAAAGIEMRGELWAMMLDAKRTFDEVVERYSADPAARDRLLANRIYQEMSNAVAGSQEYMAMEKLNELDEEGRFDVLVLDTPPTRNAIDFLDAPSRVSRFVDSRALGAFLRPGGRFLGRGSSLLFRALQRITGVDVMEDVSEFFAAVAGMTQGFRERANRVEALLAARTTAFLLVTSPQPEAVEEAVYFGRRLDERRLRLVGVVVNRVHRLATGAAGTVARGELDGLVCHELAGKVERSLEEAERLAELDERSIDRLRLELRGTPLVLVPQLADDVHAIDGLAEIDDHLFARAPAGGDAGAEPGGRAAVRR